MIIVLLKLILTVYGLIMYILCISITTFFDMNYVRISARFINGFLDLWEIDDIDLAQAKIQDRILE